jgi:glycosyltransferase involved in cell wall biosynthesis
MKYYFDITDLVKFAQKNGSVSGFQRVQIRVLQHLSSGREKDEILCAYAINRFSGIKVCRAKDLFTDEVYSASRMLVRLGIEKPSTSFSKLELYGELAKYKKGSLRRVLRKVELLTLGRLFPDYARAQMSLPRRSNENEHDQKTIETWPLKGFEDNDHIVMIGTNWNTSAFEKRARQHSKRGGRVSQVIYDLIPYRYPQYCIDSLTKKFNIFLNRSRSFASQYICISEATRNDLLDYLSDFNSDIPVKSWPLAHEFEGYERNEKCLESLQPDRLKKIQRPFVLCVGTIEVRKNGVALLKVWQRLLKELGDKTPQLVFAGKYGWKIEAFKKLLQEDLSLQQAVTIIPQATDADLAVLYQNCLFFAYPSLVEGWGLPVGEAAWFGKYSIASASSSLPEVCGDLVDYVDPNNIDDFMQSIKHAIMDEEYRKCREENISQASLRTWKDVAVHLNQLLDH